MHQAWQALKAHRAATAGDAPQAAVADDGPYVFHAAGKRLEALWVCAGKVVRETRRARGGATIQPRCGYPHALAIPARIEAAQAPLPPGARIVALSSTSLHVKADSRDARERDIAARRLEEKLSPVPGGAPSRRSRLAPPRRSPPRATARGSRPPR